MTTRSSNESIILIKELTSTKCFNGLQKVYTHTSKLLKCDMNFAIYLPFNYETHELPVLIWLSGLTCTEQNFISKSGFQRYANEYDIIVVAPDTSPRGLNIDGIRDSWDFGEGASFYVDATQDKYKDNFQMYSYINNELYQLIVDNFKTNKKFSIFGHSMGGHGALVSFLKNRDKYVRVSAFAPITNPIKCAWGKKAFDLYLGENNLTKWKEYDSTELILSYEGKQCDILIDQGNDDTFYTRDKQLLPENFINACKQKENLINLEFNFHDGYDHSYYFIASFIEKHFKFHLNGFNSL